MNKTNLSSLIWSVADDVLRGVFKPNEYGRIILPFVVFRRLDCILEPRKDEIHQMVRLNCDHVHQRNVVEPPSASFSEGVFSRRAIVSIELLATK